MKKKLYGLLYIMSFQAQAYEEYQKELHQEIKLMLLKSEELDDVSGLAKPEPMTSE